MAPPTITSLTGAAAAAEGGRGFGRRSAPVGS